MTPSNLLKPGAAVSEVDLEKIRRHLCDGTTDSSHFYDCAGPCFSYTAELLAEVTRLREENAHLAEAARDEAIRANEAENQPCPACFRQ